jgi:DNA-binding NarL/FixJ family response regulator
VGLVRCLILCLANTSLHCFMLTREPREVLNQLLRGQRLPAIATSLFLSQNTVRNVLSSIFRQLGVHSQSELLPLLRP